MDKGAMKEPAASTPVWDELEERVGPEGASRSGCSSCWSRR